MKHCPAFWNATPCPLSVEECQEQHIAHGPEDCDENCPKEEESV